MKAFSFLLTLSFAVIAAHATENWPHWRGPHANGTAPDAAPPLSWDGPSAKNVRWKAPLEGRGGATPIVWGNQIFVVSAVKTDRAARPDELPTQKPGVTQMTPLPTHFFRFIVTSYDRDTGAVRWRHTPTEAVPHEGHHDTHSYAAGSPTTDGERLYVSFGSRGIFCYDLAGRLLWERKLESLTTRYAWGDAVTPVIHRGSLLLNWDQETDSALYCLDAATGKTKWRAARDEVTTWTTPYVTEYAGKTQVILNGTKAIRSHDLATGSVMWECAGTSTNAIPAVLRHGDAAIAMSGHSATSVVSIPLSLQGDLGATAKVNWRYTVTGPYVPSPTLVGDHLYFVSRNNNLLTVLDARNGQPVLDRVRLPGVRQFYASPVFAGGRVYFVDRDGVTVVLRPGATLDVIATNILDDPVDASPVAVGRQLFLRSAQFLYCLQATD